MTQVLERIRTHSAPRYGTLDALRENPALGILRFRAQSRWIDGARDRSGAATNPLLQALAACLTTTLVSTATACSVRLTEVTTALEGDMDVRGALGLTDEARTGFSGIRVDFTVTGDASPDQLRELVEPARAVVFDLVGDGVPVAIAVNARCSS
jgi:uncharacterized OsmC-like protein